MPQWLTALLVGGIVAVGLAPFVLAFAWLPMRRKAVDEEVTREQRLAILRNTGLAMLGIVLIVAVAFTVLRKEPATGSATGSAAGMPGGMPGGMPAQGQGQASVPDLPPRLAGVPLAETLTADQALQQVTAFLPSQFPLSGAVVGNYKNGDHESQIWVASTDADAMASAMAEQMAAAIAGGDTPFGMPQQMGGGVWKLQGFGQTQYFFASGNQVWWVSADPSLAEKSLGQVRAAAGL
jgi:hypothetical protein